MTFVRVPPSYLARLSPIMTLSVGVAVTTSLQTNIAQRLSWLVASQSFLFTAYAITNNFSLPTYDAGMERIHLLLFKSIPLIGGLSGV